MTQVQRALYSLHLHRGRSQVCLNNAGEESVGGAEPAGESVQELRLSEQGSCLF